jgi:ABC-type lipoprotein release transport system permease subunit
MALGAEPAKLFSSVMGQGLLLAAIDAVTGLAGAFLLTRLLEGMVSILVSILRVYFACLFCVSILH